MGARRAKVVAPISFEARIIGRSARRANLTTIREYSHKRDASAERWLENEIQRLYTPPPADAGSES